MSTPIKAPNTPERGSCEAPVRREPAVMPQEAPVPIKFPDTDAPIPVPNWPQPEKVPAR